MEFLIPSFFAGTLTVLAPCVLALLPVILGGTVGTRNPLRPLVIAVSLSISVIIFTLLLKATTAFIGVPEQALRYISGGLIGLFGLFMVFPSIWDRLSFKLKLYKSETLLHKSGQKKGLGGAVLLGASLGPVFSTCSPTYALILGIVLPQSFTVGLTNIIVYSVGLMIPLLLIGYGGQKIASKFKGASNPKGWLKRSLGVLLLVTGILIFTSYDKVLEAYILESGYLGPIGIEQSFLDKMGN
ncbi:MAG: sulfite exporter TauE/SafE family protein [bacterium]|nr:sulfite exporter TauE/SafE family protein [bacterium]